MEAEKMSLVSVVMTRKELRRVLSVSDEAELKNLFARARAARDAALGNRIFLRGLIEYSNRCRKDCFYCGLRVSNRAIERYTMDKEDVIKSAEEAWMQGYRAFVIQTGERNDHRFADEIEDLVRNLMQKFGDRTEITLSCGEQSSETYRRWRQAGALRYLLRIETSSPDLFYKIHPMDQNHRMTDRIDALLSIREAGFLVGSGVMIGLPDQDIDDLVDDLLFLEEMGVDMVGMGPYLQHQDTPMGKIPETITGREKLLLSLKMIAALRLLMPGINIAASTALDAIDPMGRVLAFRAGANVLMPNFSLKKYTGKYDLYENKPRIIEAKVLTDRVAFYGQEEGYFLDFKNLPH